MTKPPAIHHSNRRCKDTPTHYYFPSPLVNSEKNRDRLVCDPDTGWGPNGDRTATRLMLIGPNNLT